MVHRRPRFRQHHALCMLILMIFALSGGLALLGGLLPVATAQIDNNQPSQPFASIVNCIRSGSDLGQPPEVSPRFATSCFGTKVSSGGYTSNTDSLDANPNDVAVLDFGDAKVDGTNDLYGASSHTPDASLIQTGAVYGLAYGTGTNPTAPAFAQQKRLFAGAYNKMQTRFGPGGPGAIYLINQSSGAVSLYVQVPAVVPGPATAQPGPASFPNTPGDGSRVTFPDSIENPTYTPENGGLHRKAGDTTARDLVGKTALGDIDLDAQERYLYAVNLTNKRVYRFDTWNANPQSTMTVLPPLPVLSNPNACNASGASGPQDLRPFGLAVTQSSLYLGFVCSAESSQNRAQDLAAGVIRYDLATGTWASSNAVAFGLAAFDAQRSTSSTPAKNAPWQPWRSGTAPATVFAMPLLSDIAFDEAGNMVIGLRDRTADMNSMSPYSLPAVAEGDILMATPSGTTGVWNAPISAGAERFSDAGQQNTAPEQEAADGGIAYIPGKHNGGYGGEVISNFLDPYRPQSMGAAWWDTAGGVPTAYEEIYQGGIGGHQFGKAAGLGDIELLCAWRAVGDRVWRDSNGNGVQDAGESDINGVRMQLFAASDTTFSTPLATVTTGSVSGMSGNWRFYVNPFQSYRVRIDPTMFNAGQPLAGLGLTPANVGGNDSLDSDANAQGAIDIPAAGNGDVNVSFDAGLRVQANVHITKTGPASAPIGSSFSYTLAYGNSGPSSAASVQVVDTLPTGLTFVSATPAPASVSGQIVTWNLGTLVAGANGSITVNVTANNNAPSSVTNSVRISTTTTETNTGDNTSTATTAITRPNVYITKTGPASAVTGSTFAYTLAYGNNGAASAASVQVVDTLPTGLTFVSATPAPSSISGQTLRWNLGTLAAGTSGSITINVTVAANAPANVTNVASISTTTTETNTGDNTGTATTAITRPEVYIDKTGPAIAATGSTFAYTLAYGNSGTAAAANVTIVDTLPTGLTFVSATPAPSSISGQTLRWNLGTLAAGTSGSITVNVTVSGSAPASVTNVVTISTTTPGDNSGNNTDSASTSIPRPGVYVGKNGPAFSTVGNAFSYTLSYGNNGGAAANNVTIVDTLPAELVFVSATPAPSSISGQTLTWNLGTLAANATGTISVQVRSVSSAADGTVVVNVATISTSSPGDDPSDNTSSASTTLQRTDVTIAKSSSTTFPVLSGQQVVYYLDYSNDGPAAAANVVLNDTVPPQLTNVSWSCASGCSSSGSGNSISINLGTLAAGATGRVTITGTAMTSAGREDFTNTAAISTSTPETDTANNQSSVDGAVWTADVQVVKLAQAQVIAGETFTATLSYGNNGPAPASSAILTDTLPSGISLIAAAPAPSSVSGQTLVWDLGDLAAGDSGVISLTLQSDAALPDQSIVTNQAQISTPTVDRDGTNDQSSAQTLVVTQADLAVVKTGPAVVVAGDVIQYTLTYTNTGPSVAGNVLITDTLPAALTFASATPAPASVSGQTVVWNLGDLAPHAAGTITVQVNSSASQLQATITVINTVQINSPTTDPMPGDNTGSATTNIQTADLSVVKTAPAVVMAGVPFTATLDYANAGPARATNATLNDILPAGLTVLSTSPLTTGPGLRWNLGDVAPGASGRIVLTLLAPTTAISGTAYVNQAVVDTTAPDRDASNDTSSATSIVQSQADLSIVKNGPAGPILSGSVVTYRLTYRNSGPSQAQAVVVRDTPPPGFTLGSDTPPPSSTSGGVLTWNIGALDAGSSGVIMLTGTLAGSGATTNRTNTAQISSPTPDPDSSNNTSSVTTVVQKPDLSVVKTDGRAQVAPGDVLTYTLTIRNAGPVTATGVVLTDTLPAGLVPLGGGWTSAGGNRYTQPIGAVGPGAVVTRTMSILLPNPLPASLRTAIVNSANVADDGSAGPDPTPGDNSSTDQDTPLVGRIGDYVWLDADGDGQQDSTEHGLPGVVVQLLDPATGALVATTTTDANGLYSFDGLRMGQYQVQLDPTTTQGGTYQGYEPTTSTLIAGSISASQSSNLTFDFGLRPRNTTAVVLAYFLTERNSDGALIRWGTLAERDTAYFQVLRATTPNRASAVSAGALTSLGSQGGDYRLLDPSAPPSGPLYYWLIEVERNGTQNVYGPATISVQSTRSQVYLPLVQR